jgi:subtilisin-like proprotein convertase family protein
VLYDLTLHGYSSSFSWEYWLDDASAEETGDATFSPYVIGAEPLSYQWYVQYPWMDEWNWTRASGAINDSFTLTNVDSWVGARFDVNNNLRYTQVGVWVTNAAGESVWLNPLWLEQAKLQVDAQSMSIPGAGSYGPAGTYPKAINVFGQPTNLASVTVTLWGLSHSRSADLGVLLVTPANKEIMLMSNVGGTNGVAGAILSFGQSATQLQQSSAIASGGPWLIGPSNYGAVTQMPRVGNDPPPLHDGRYTTELGGLLNDNPNGVWKLYIYDFSQPGGMGQLTGSWELHFDFQ